MDTEERRELLIDSFEILKDSWKEKHAAISIIFREMAKIDMPCAINMLKYVIDNNPSDASEIDPVNPFLNGLVFPTEGCMGKLRNFRDLIPYLKGDSTLLKDIFLYNNYLSDYVGYLLGYIIAENDSSFTKEALSYLNGNVINVSCYKIGKITSFAIEHAGVGFSPEGKVILKDFIETIEDKRERAEAFVAYLSLE